MKVKRIPKLCQKYDMPAVGLTDTHNMFGALEFATACADNGIQPIVGCQVRLYEPGEFGKEGLFFDLSLLCQNEEGYQNLMALISQSFIHATNNLPPHLTLSQIKEQSRGLLCLSGGEGSNIHHALSLGKEEVMTKHIQEYQDIFKDRFYLELNRFIPTTLSLEKDKSLVDTADRLGIPLVATNNVFFEEKSMFKAHDALLCIAEGRYVNEEDRRKVTPQHYFKSTQDMEAMFPDLPEALSNATLIAKRCHFMPRGRKPILPSFDCHGKSEDDEIRTQAFEGLKDRLGEEIPPHYIERLEYELSIIKTMGFSGYFLIVADFIKYAKSKSIPVGPGRGSGAGSLVAWSLTITDMDPIRFGLIFERFLNPERVSMPDFDVDFCQDRRDEVIDYVKEKYGADRVAHIITFGKLQARAVLRDVGRVLQMPYGQVDKITKLIPNNPANPITLEEALVMEPALKEAQQSDDTVKELIELGSKLNQFLDRIIALLCLFEGGLHHKSFFKCDGICGVIGDKLCDFIHLPIRHLKDTSDISEHRTRLEFSKGNDMCHAVGAVFFFDIVNDFITTILAEIHIKIRHGDAFWVEKTLKNKAKTNGIHVRDG